MSAEYTGGKTAGATLQNLRRCSEIWGLAGTGGWDGVARLLRSTMAASAEGVRMRRRVGIGLMLAAAALGQDVSRMDQVVQSYVGNNTFMGPVSAALGERP
jgi:hypothetical protein